MTCLIVIDMLNDFLDRWPSREKDVLIGRTNDLIGIMREHGYPVIWVRQAFKADLSDAFLEMRDRQITVTLEGTAGAEIDERLHRKPDDPEIVKKRYSAFFGTGLDEVLAKLAPEKLILAGINTHACIRMAAIDAYQRDYRVIVASDCVDSYDKPHAEVTLNYLRDKIALVQTNEQILQSFQASQP